MTEGLRERKKRANREAIAAAARTLFAERGFDAVTVAEVAVAADVSEKTVFNHFPTKEDLAFAGREKRMERLVADIRERAAGASVLDVFRATTHAMLDDLASGRADELRTVIQVIRGSRVLQSRLALGWEEEARILADVIGETTGAREGDVVPAVVGRTLVWTHRTVFRVALMGVMRGEDVEQLAARLRGEADRAYDALAGGLGEYGRR